MKSNLLLRKFKRMPFVSYSLFVDYEDNWLVLYASDTLDYTLEGNIELTNDDNSWKVVVF